MNQKLPPMLLRAKIFPKLMNIWKLHSNQKSRTRGKERMKKNERMNEARIPHLNFKKNSQDEKKLKTTKQ